MKIVFLAVGEARIASLEELALQGEVTILALPLKVSLALHNRVLCLSEVVIASLLTLNDILFLASRLRSLALNSALVLTLRLRSSSKSEAALTMLLAHIGALALTVGPEAFHSSFDDD